MLSHDSEAILAGPDVIRNLSAFQSNSNQKSVFGQ